MGICKTKVVAHVELDDQQHLRRTGSLSVSIEDLKTNDRKIAKYLQREKKIDNKKKKLLLLGTGSSGKSTVFRQLKCIHHSGLDASTIHESKYTIRSNCIAAILTLLKKSQELYEKDKIYNSDCYIDLIDDNNDDNIIINIRNVLNYSNCNSIKHQNIIEELDEKQCNILCESIKYLWNLNEIRSTFNKRQYYSFIENMDYFFNKLDIIFNIHYNPSIQDTLKCRIRTAGLIEDHFIIDSVQFDIHDVGGQRNERKKWIQLFEGVTALIFVAALNHYCTVLFEDETKNSMHESLELFDEVCNQKWFRKTEIILFLNKDDLFKERIKEQLSLSIAFDDWKGPDYEPQDDADKDLEHFKDCYEAACDFIQEQYTNLNRNKHKKIFVHITTATNKDNVESVFWDVQNIVVSGNMKISGIV